MTSLWRGLWCRTWRREGGTLILGLSPSSLDCQAMAPQARQSVLAERKGEGDGRRGGVSMEMRGLRIRTSGR